MKIKLGFLFACLFAGAIASYAQPGGMRRTVAERVQVIHQKIDSAFKLDAAKLTQTDSTFATYYRATDKLREELTSGGERPDFQVMREKMQPLAETRDAQLKTIFTESQYKTFKDEIEPAMMQRRGGGGGNRPQQ